MNRIHYILFLLLIFIGLSSCKKDPSYYEIHISGKVIDAKTGLGVSGAVLHRYKNNWGYMEWTDAYAETDSNGNFSFYGTADEKGDFQCVVVKSGYGAEFGGQLCGLNSKKDIASFNPLLYPNTYLSFVITKTTLTDSLIKIGYAPPQSMNPGYQKNISNASSPDTLTFKIFAARENVITLFINRYNTNPPTSPYSETTATYTITPTSSDTTFYPVSY